MPEQWTILKLIKWTADYLSKKGIDTARLDAELMLAYLLKIDRTRLYMNFDQPLNKDELANFKKLLERRAKHEPLQYITGQQEFWSLPFKVSPSVLIPRPETELLVEESMKELSKSFPEDESIEILDIGTGSGALAAALASEIKGAKVTGVDISPQAVKIARENIETNNLSSSVNIMEGDLFEPVKDKKFHLIVSNPPYIPKGDLKDLQPEVAGFEPLSALDGGDDGLDYYRRIIPESLKHLIPGGWLMLEHGIGQSDDIISIFKEKDAFTDIESINDLAGIDRVVKGRRKEINKKPN